MMNYLKKNIFLLALLVLVFSAPVFSFAVDVDGDLSGGSVKIVNPIKADSIYGFIKVILEGVIKIGIPIVALAIIYSGFLFVSARGKPEELKKAKNALTYTLIGAAILLGSWAIAQLISETVLAL